MCGEDGGNERSRSEDSKSEKKRRLTVIEGVRKYSPGLVDIRRGIAELKSRRM